MGCHAYSILGTFELKNSGGQLTLDNRGDHDVKLVKLRNPWGKGEWQQDWSDRSRLWERVSAQTKQQLGYNQKDEGIFFMAYEQFYKYYSDFQLCYYHDSFQYSFLPIQSSSVNPCFASFEIRQPGKYFLMVS